MRDPDGLAARALTTPPPGGLASAWGDFERLPTGGTILHEVEPSLDGPRVLGTEPAAYEAPRHRNASNSRVYIVSAEKAAGRPGRGLRVPVAGEIAAGQYDVTVAVHDYLEYERGLEVDRALVSAGSGAYALRVRGTSMTHVGIDPGDLVVVQPADVADNGDIVVARLSDADGPEGYVTLKRYFHKGDHIFLQSATADKAPINVYPHARAWGADRDRVKIQGRVVVIIKCATC